VRVPFERLGDPAREVRYWRNAEIQTETLPVDRVAARARSNASPASSMLVKRRNRTSSHLAAEHAKNSPDACFPSKTNRIKRGLLIRGRGWPLDR